MAFASPRPARVVHHSGRSTESPMDLDTRPSRWSSSYDPSQEPPRKRTHYESDMDWSAEPPTPSSSSLFSSFSTSSSTRSTAKPFMFDSSSLMQVDQPSTSSSSTSSGNTNTAHAPASVPPRDIASGAIQRERRKRDKLKEWQVVPKQSLSATLDNESEVDEDDDTIVDASDSPGLVAQAQRLLRRKRSSKRHHQPMHLSLHNHNYHYGTNSDSFDFGPVSAPSTSAASPRVAISDPSHWFREEGPYILLGYLQFAFNTSLVLLGLYLLTSFLLILASDIRERTQEYSIELQQEIMHCSEMYIANRCEPATRVPAMEGQCKSWEFCMNRNPKVVGKARVGAETLAEVINGFTEVISWRTMLFLLGILTVVVSFTNSTISSYRRSHTAYHEQMQHATGQNYTPHHRITSARQFASIGDRNEKRSFWQRATETGVAPASDGQGKFVEL